MCKLFWRTWCILYYGTSDKEEDNDALYGRLVFGNGITFERVPIVPSSYYRHSFTLFYLLHDHHHQFILYGMLCVFLEGTSIVKKRKVVARIKEIYTKTHTYTSSSLPPSLSLFSTSFPPSFHSIQLFIVRCAMWRRRQRERLIVVLKGDVECTHHYYLIFATFAYFFSLLHGIPTYMSLGEKSKRGKLNLCLWTESICTYTVLYGVGRVEMKNSCKAAVVVSLKSHSATQTPG